MLTTSDRQTQTDRERERERETGRVSDLFTAADVDVFKRRETS